MSGDWVKCELNRAPLELIRHRNEPDDWRSVQTKKQELL
jgi:hypothetical protein